MTHNFAAACDVRLQVNSITCYVHLAMYIGYANWCCVACCVDIISSKTISCKLYMFLLCCVIMVLLHILQILSSVLSSVMEYDRSVYNTLWVVLCDTLAVAPLTVKARVLELAASMLRKTGFTMDVKVWSLHICC